MATIEVAWMEANSEEVYKTHDFLKTCDLSYLQEVTTGPSTNTEELDAVMASEVVPKMLAKLRAEVTQRVTTNTEPSMTIARTSETGGTTPGAELAAAKVLEVGENFVQIHIHTLNF